MKTGLISLVTDPPGATVYLPDTRFLGKTPVVIRDLLPGQYLVTVDLKRYRPWVGVIPVEKKKATVLDKVLLLPEVPAPQRLLDRPFRDLVPVKDTAFFIIVGGDKIDEHLIYDVKSNVTQPLLPADSVFSADNVVSVAAEDESPYLFVEVQHNKEEKYLWIHLEHGGNQVQDLTHLFSKPPEGLRWDPRDPNLLFYLDGGSLSRVHISSAAVYPKFTDGVRAFGLLDKKIYLFGNDDRLRRMDDDGTDAGVLGPDPLLASLLLKNKDGLRLVALPDDRLFFLTEHGLLTNAFPYQWASGRIEGIDVYRPEEKALVWEKDRLGLLTGKDKFTWLYERGRDIAQVFWAYDGSHAILRDGERVLLEETGDAVKPHLSELASVKRGSRVVYSEMVGRLFYLDKNTSALMALEVLPKTGEAKSS